MCHNKYMRSYGNSEQLAKRRRRALELIDSGKRIKEVSKIIGVTERSVYRWKIDEKEPPDKSDRRPIGRPRRLSNDQLAELSKELMQGAIAHGYIEAYWTLDRIVSLIWDKFKVQYHPSAVWHIMKNMGWSNQRPRRQAIQRDDEAIQHWKRYIWSHIKRRR